MRWHDMSRRLLPALAGRALRFAPGVLGPVAVVAGVAMVSVPIALIVAGLFLLAADWRIT